MISNLDIKFINIIFYFQTYIIIFFIIKDFYTIITKKKPETWENCYEDKKMFTWYSGIYYINKKKILKFIFFLLLSKLILISQIIVGIDLFIISFFKEKIKYKKNVFYITIIIIPWIYIKILKIKIKRMMIERNDLKKIIHGVIFMNLWFTSKTVVKNSIILTNEWINWKKHTKNPFLEFYEFLRLVQKYKFNKMIEKYSKYFTF